MGVQAYPYRMVTEEVTAAPWISMDDGAQLGEFLPSWDYGSVLHLRRQVEVDASTLITECGLPPTAQLAFNVRYWPVTSMIRRTALHLRLGSMDADGLVKLVMDVEIPGADLAAALMLETTLVLADVSATDDEPFVARRPGSILWRDETTVRLEGSAGLLPVAPVSFKDQGLPEQAAWYVSLDSSEWSAAAMGNLLVLLNDDNLAVHKAMAAPDEPESAIVLDVLTVDVVCDLVGRALTDEEFPLVVPVGGRQAEMSTAGLVQGLIMTFLSMPTETLEDAVTRLRDEWQRDPSRVRARAQSSLRFPGSRTA
ncbi:hypothetical protein ACWKSP_21060 [Micromonosporaceae bacterium Da 78-11]